MCGIYGIISTKKDKRLPHEAVILFQHLIVETVPRGTHSFGYTTADHKEGSIQTFKRVGHPVSIGRAIQDEMSEDILASHAVMGHNRYASRGKITKNNAHPFQDQQHVFSLIHNGTMTKKTLKEIGNKVKTRMPLPKSDTKAFAKIIGTSISNALKRRNLEYADSNLIAEIARKWMSQLYSYDLYSMAILTPDSIIWARNIGKPVCIAHLVEQGLIVFASTREILVNAINNVFGKVPKKLIYFSTPPNKMTMFNFSRKGKVSSRLQWWTWDSPPFNFQDAPLSYRMKEMEKLDPKKQKAVFDERGRFRGFNDGSDPYDTETIYLDAEGFPIKKLRKGKKKKKKHQKQKRRNRNHEYFDGFEDDSLQADMFDQDEQCESEIEVDIETIDEVTPIDVETERMQRESGMSRLEEHLLEQRMQRADYNSKEYFELYQKRFGMFHPNDPDFNCISSSNKKLN